MPMCRRKFFVLRYDTNLVVGYVPRVVLDLDTRIDRILLGNFPDYCTVLDDLLRTGFCRLCH